MVVASAAMSQETRFSPLVNIAVPFFDWSHSKQALQSISGDRVRVRVRIRVRVHDSL